MIGIFGGTLDPVHYGHLRPLWEVKEALRFDQVRLIPSYIPPHRGQPGASAEQRLAMLKLAVADVAAFQVDERELQRGGPSYTVDTLQSLRDDLGSESICWVMGLDAFLNLDKWHRWSHLLDLAHIVVMQRPGSEHARSGAVAELVETHQAFDVNELRLAPAGLIYFQDVTQLDISATAIRSRLAKEQDVRFLMPDTVRNYIKSNRLYTKYLREINETS